MSKPKTRNFDSFFKNILSILLKTVNNFNLWTPLNRFFFTQRSSFVNFWPEIISELFKKEFSLHISCPISKILSRILRSFKDIKN